MTDEIFSSSEGFTQAIIHEITHSVDTEDYLYFNVNLKNQEKVYQSDKDRPDQYVSAMTHDTSAARIFLTSAAKLPLICMEGFEVMVM
ncbi:hypothetical protein ACFFJN_12760 [Erwinia mallotivora]|uniref:hypothetical protein n=1 Tax=Erwinia mallotivora TaxID=69222 RepID=UPI0035F00A22